MPNIIIKRPPKAVSLDLPILPYLEDGRLDDDMLFRMFCYLRREWSGLFGEHTVIPHYMLAERLDIHRVLADEWAKALLKSGYASYAYRSGLECLSPRELFDDERDASEKYLIEFDLSLASSYEPWTDRSLDTRMTDPWFPYFIDMHIDRYYLAHIDEVLLFEGYRRQRWTKRPFKPIMWKRHENDHPLTFFDAKGAGRHFQKNGRPRPPPTDRRRQIDQSADGLTMGEKNNGQKEERAVIGSWIDAAILEAACPKFDEGDGFVYPPPPAPLARGKRIRRRDNGGEDQ